MGGVTAELYSMRTAHEDRQPTGCGRIYRSLLT
jgi:hypothetical protein